MKIATVTPRIHPGDCKYNVGKVIEYAERAFEQGCDLVVFPEFVVTGATCGSLFSCVTMKEAVSTALEIIAKDTAEFAGMSIAVGVPVVAENENNGVKSGVALIRDGKCQEIFCDVKSFIIGYEKVCFCTQPGTGDGADVVVHMQNLEFTAGSTGEYLSELKEVSNADGTSHISVSAGPGESVDECVYNGLKSHARGGEIIDYSVKEGLCIFDTKESGAVGSLFFKYNGNEGFIPEDEKIRENFCLDILNIQATALGERLEFLGMRKCVLGLSGGLDSTLALVAAVNAFDRKGWDRKGIICVTMPGFGTGSTTKNNAYRLAEIFGVTLIEIDIKEQVALHLRSIGQPEDGDSFVSDVTFENAQARARTMILMDLANKENSIVIGTGDMSELALGWCTYNGDHMSMYSANSGVPKTFIPHILRTYVEKVVTPEDRSGIREIFESVTNTPVSPELLPVGEDGEVVQKTEDTLGPYELHDYFLYLFLEKRFSVRQMYKMVADRFAGVYGESVISDKLKIFIRRFFTQQFKRTCMPAGAKVLRHSLSPRSGFVMPGDVYAGEF